MGRRMVSLITALHQLGPLAQRHVDLLTRGAVERAGAGADRTIERALYTPALPPPSPSSAARTEFLPHEKAVTFLALKTTSSGINGLRTAELEITASSDAAARAWVSSPRHKYPDRNPDLTENPLRF
jgi:hypothetical protein